MSFIDRVRATMKSDDTEGAFELYVTRTPGYLWALLFRALHVHPVAITVASIFIGSAAGFCFYSHELKWNLLGMFFLIWANWYDCADGQLARMTNQKTLVGRVLDGFAGDVWFFFIYWNIAFRIFNDPIPFIGVRWGFWFWPLGLYAGHICHARQCMIGDYYRNIHLWFINKGSELCTSAQEHARYNSITWLSRDWFEKLYLFFYISYTEGQENMAPKFVRLYNLIEERYGGCENLPAEVRERFREQSKPLMKYTNILTFDTRVGVLFFSLLIGHPWLYPLFEVTVLEYIRYWLIRKHEGICQHLYEELA